MDEPRLRQLSPFAGLSTAERNKRIDTMGPGDFFGEVAVVDDGGRRNASIVATSPVRLVTLTAHYMRVVRERMPQIAQQIDRVIADRRPPVP
jgi:CRP-like cAMP-binding protein